MSQDAEAVKEFIKTFNSLTEEKFTNSTQLAKSVETLQAKIDKIKENIRVIEEKEAEEE